MNIQIEFLSPHHKIDWDEYVLNHPEANVYHLSGWQDVIQDTYRLKSFYMAARTTNEFGKGQVKGILPLFLIKSPIFGNGLHSIPFFDLGGLLADDEDTEYALMKTAIQLKRLYEVKCIELRQEKPFSKNTMLRILSEKENDELEFAVNTSKVRMLVHLPNSADALMNAFKSKLRSQIKRPLKAGLDTRTGGLELLDDFYRVFAVNMRDLGSPVHSRNLIKNVMRMSPESSRIVVVYLKDKAIAASLITGFKEIMLNPWSSALQKYNRLSPNMLLYWTMLSYACENGFRIFDFGRSTRGEGTYNFKSQWGAKEVGIEWISIKNAQSPAAQTSPDKNKFRHLIQIWKRMPVRLSLICGPMLRKYISL